MCRFDFLYFISGDCGNPYCYLLALSLIGLQFNLFAMAVHGKLIASTRRRIIFERTIIALLILADIFFTFSPHSSHSVPILAIC